MERRLEGWRAFPKPLVAACDRMQTDWVNRSEWTQTDAHRSLRTYAHSHIPLITRSLGLTLKMWLSAHSILCACRNDSSPWRQYHGQKRENVPAYFSELLCFKLIINYIVQLDFEFISNQ